MQTDEFHVSAEYQVSGETHHGLSEGFVGASKHIYQKSYSTGKVIYSGTSDSGPPNSGFTPYSGC